MRIQFCTRTRFARHAAAIDGIHEATGGAPPGAALGEIGRRVAHPQFRGAIAWHGRQIAGYGYGSPVIPGPVPVPGQASLRISDLVACPGGEALRPWLGAFEIADVRLLPQWRGRGAGAAIVTYLAAGHMRPAVLAVEQGNLRAQGVYRRLGFTIVATVNGPGAYVMARRARRKGTAPLSDALMCDAPAARVVDVSATRPSTTGCRRSP